MDKGDVVIMMSYAVDAAAAAASCCNAVCTMHRRLREQGIALVFPEVLKHAACADVACFDKTGTLTGSLVSPHVLLLLFLLFFSCPRSLC